MSARFPADYPGKKHLNKREAMAVLRDGPQLDWFEPWAEHGVVLASLGQRFGFIHVLPADDDSNQPRQYDIRLFDSRADLAYALEHLHSKHPACGDDCLGLFYFTPDDPLSVRLVVELDDEAGEEANQ